MDDHSAGFFTIFMWGIMLLTLFGATIVGIQITQANHFKSYVDLTIQRDGGLTEEAQRSIIAWSKDQYGGRFKVTPVLYKTSDANNDTGAVTVASKSVSANTTEAGTPQGTTDEYTVDNTGNGGIVFDTSANNFIYTTKVPYGKNVQYNVTSNIDTSVFSSIFNNSAKAGQTLFGKNLVITIPGQSMSQVRGSDD